MCAPSCHAWTPTLHGRGLMAKLSDPVKVFIIERLAGDDSMTAQQILLCHRRQLGVVRTTWPKKVQ
jgi:hypothetical protein